MTLRECYQAIGGDYEGVASRLRTDERIQKFVLKFLKDENFNILTKSIEANNIEEAFRAAHTLKGVSQNLGFTGLHDASDALTECLRGGEFDDGLYQDVKREYQKIIDAANTLA